MDKTRIRIYDDLRWLSAIVAVTRQPLLFMATTFALVAKQWHPWDWAFLGLMGGSQLCCVKPFMDGKGWQGEIVQLTWRKALGYLVLVNMRTNWEHAHAIMGHTSATLITLSTLNLSRLNESYMQTQLATWKFCRTLVAFPYAQFPWPRCGAVQRPRCLAFF